jgi:deoxycytidylate deaminase
VSVEYNFFDSDPKQRVHAIFLNMAKEVSKGSPDPSTKVGAVLVKDGIPIGTGFNRFPKGCCQDDEIYADRPRKYLRILHAEENAILNALANKWDVEDSVLYVWPPSSGPCCSICARMIIELNIGLLVYPIAENEFAERCKQSLAEGLRMLNEAGITSVGVTQDWVEKWMNPISGS